MPPGHGCGLRGSPHLSDQLHSIWPADRENPLGWHDAGKQGTKAECLAYIEEVWTDMRPKSLREAMQRMERGEPGDVP